MDAVSLPKISTVIDFDQRAPLRHERCAQPLARYYVVTQNDFDIHWMVD